MKRSTTKQLDFLRTWYPRMMIGPLTIKFNARFATEKSECAVKSMCSNHGIRCGRPTGGRKGQFLSFTKKQARFLERKYKKLSIPGLTTAFNEKFSESKRWQQIRAFVHNQRFQSGRTGYFPKSHAPWNKNTKGLMKPNSGTLQKGHTPKNWKPIGHERIDSRDGYVLIKTDSVNPYTGRRGWYRPKHVLVWEQMYGPVPPGHNIILLDGNKLKCELENLAMVSDAELARLNQMCWKESPLELRSTILALAKLKTIAFKAGRNERTRSAQG